MTEQCKPTVRKKCFPLLPNTYLVVVPGNINAHTEQGSRLFFHPGGGGAIRKAEEPHYLPNPASLGAQEDPSSAVLIRTQISFL